MNKKIAILIGVLIAVFFVGRFTAPSGTTHEEPHVAEEHVEETEWTCSMHPQIKLPEKGQCPICFMDLIPLSKNEDDEEGETVLSMSERAKILAGIETAPVVRGEAVREIKLFGKVGVDETKSSAITSRIKGRIDWLGVDYTGQQVKRGTLLAKIYSPELLSLQRELLEAHRSYQREKGTALESSMKRTFEASREKLRLLGFGPKALEKIIDRGTTSEHMNIYSTQTGVVIKKLVNEGNYVSAGSPLFKVADLRSVWAVFDAYESDLQWFRKGQTVLFTAESYPGEQFEGEISFIDPIVDPKKRTARIRVNLKNSDGRLKPDMLITGYAEGELLSEKNHLLIPGSAPLFTGERAIVYVELNDRDKPTYEGREVKLGVRVGADYVVKSGLEEGEKVVVNGAFKIDGELQIRAKPSMMNPEGGVTMTGHERHSMPGDAKLVSAKPVVITKSFKSGLETVRDSYFEIGLKLAGDDEKGAREAMTLFRDELKKVKAGKTAAYHPWHEQMKKMADALVHLEHQSDMNGLRELFETLSTAMIELSKRYEPASPYNLAFCPMAFGNKGAYWLQKEEVVNNPYFGAMMLKCGRIEGSFGGDHE